MKPLLLVIAAICSLIQTDVPFKNSDEFQVKVDLKFKQRPSSFGANTYSNSGERLDQNRVDLASFLVIDISQLKILEEEVKISVVDSKGKSLLKKKTAPVPELHLEMGFVDDLKKGEAANEIVVYFLSSDKKELRKIVCTIKPDGDFLVNGKWHGKF